MSTRLIMRLCFTAFFATLVALRGAQAQDLPAYIQIHAWPDAAEAEAGLQNYAGYLPDVTGFTLSNGLYVAVLGPYPRDEAVNRLQTLRASGQIPGDSYISYRSWYEAEFQAGIGSGTGSGIGSGSQPETAPQPAAQPLPDAGTFGTGFDDETPEQARRSEAQLSRAERDQLQIALGWAGYYNGPVDGAFGQGTRNSMARWQQANGFSATGILTTAQRSALIGQYNALLDDLGLELYSDNEAGIAMELPLGAVQFDRHEAPFAHFTPRDEAALPARVLLISQAGDEGRLAALYEIMQTLAILPEGGARSRRADSFTVEGENAQIVSHAEARLQDGHIKGFILVWPMGDSDRRSRLLGEMQASFTRLPGVLPYNEGIDASQGVDLVAGLRVRKPLFARSGVFVSRDGAVATLADDLASCGQITIAGDHAASVARSDATSGLALLRPTAALAPMRVAEVSSAVPQIGSEIAVAGYSYAGMLGAASVTYGDLADRGGLNGETGVSRLEIATLPGDAGGPVMNASGAVIGLLQAGPDGDRSLPQSVAFATDGASLATFLSGAGISTPASITSGTLPPLTLARQAREMTALVECWE
ncbi:serine protease [Pseudooceanicola algae]|uniref:Peptidoglycan binding-like domain-containing protein n=1 Tax=Pseudooceanicola algae TaxID=1537215 RepID=A0A418SEX7_9RHOB|nr:serine protease [Pseudooceanicola algae]QPM89055.1 hypothetical protein PSAL_002640 [Pseudooceanicola algae]